jgi:ubiquinone/menaquinone biosynthesis C-methylase UbiE
MTKSTGFSDVDGSARAEALVDYLAILADRLAAARRAGYEMLRLAPGASVLDVGCGGGEVCVELAARVGPSGRVAGIDPSETMIAAARRTAGVSPLPIELRVASIYALPFPDGVFDAVRAERVFQHLDDPEAGLREMLRVTRAGGRVMAIDPDHGQHGLALDDPAHRRVHDASTRALLRMIANPHSGTRLRAMFVRAGLAEIEQVIHDVEITHADFVHAVFLHDRLDMAVATGDITRADADAFVAALEERARAGAFFANAFGYNVAGTKV